MDICMQAEDAVTTSDAVLATSLKQHKDLKIEYLGNGLRVVILPNRSPVDRFEAHLEVHAGSVDERVDEQGLAHLVEHVTFLGSRKRETLLGTGARSNAYTDFHHTVFHVHAPTINASTGRLMLPQVLDALVEIAFEPEILPSRIEKERKAVTAEAQMMNTIEYRMDCQLLTYLHAENALGCRFPIGKMDQVGGWSREAIASFWARHYYPANATLYVVGDFDAASALEAVHAAFGRVPTSPAPPRGIEQEGIPPGASAAELLHLTLRPGALSVRPPVEHAWGCGPGEELARRLPPPVSVFRHRLLQLFQLSVFCKLPVQAIARQGDLRRAFMVRVLLSVLQFRINARYVAADPPFVSIELDHSDSGREGCAVSTLTVTSEPGHWRGAVRVATQEMRRLQRHGVTASELDRYRAALLRDSEQLAEAADSMPSAEHLDFVMESLALGHTVMDSRGAHAALVAAVGDVGAEEIGALARSLLSFASHYGRERELAREYEADPASFAAPGPSVATAVVACLPAFQDAAGHKAPGTIAVGRGGSLTTSQHVDAALGVPPPPAQGAELDLDGGDEGRDSAAAFELPPPGAVPFVVTPEEIAAALTEVSDEDFEARPEIVVPDALLSDADAGALVAERRPAWVAPVVKRAGPRLSPHEEGSLGEGVVLRRLSNGIALNYRVTANEPRAASIRVVAAGGRAREAPGAAGAVTVGVRALSESGTAGPWAREQVELFCISRLINCMLEADEEQIVIDMHVAVGEGGLAAAFQLLHLLLQSPVWDGAAAERAKQMYLSHARGLGSSLERGTADRIMAVMLGPDRQFREPAPEEIAALDLDGMRRAVAPQLVPGNLELSVVGDFDPAELEDAALRYLGTVSSAQRETPAATDRVAAFQHPPRHERHSLWRLHDSDSRGCAFIAGRAPPRWQRAAPSPAPAAPTAASRQDHPLFPSVSLALLTEVINSRLFTTVRDTLGLTYDVSFELALFDRLPLGWFHVAVTSTPAKIGEAMLASLRVLRTLRTQPITTRELQRAKRTLLARQETDSKDNGFWLALLGNLQNPAVPEKTVECLCDLKTMYEAASVNDLYTVLQEFDFSDDAIYSCIGVSGQDADAVKSHPLAAAPAPAAQEVRDVDAFFSAVKSFIHHGVRAPTGDASASSS